jgi:hypothetical protein
VSSTKPQIDQVNHYKFYNLPERDWRIDASDSSIKFNRPILQDIAKDFSDITGIEYKSIMSAFGKYILGRSAEDELLIYTNKGSKTVFYYFTHVYTDTYEALNKEDI